MSFFIKSRLSIKARVTAWFAAIMFIIASAVFYVMIYHRTTQVKIDSEHNLESSVNMFADIATNPDKNYNKPNENHHPPQNEPQNDMPPQSAPSAPNMQNTFLDNGKKPRTYAGGVHMAIYDENGEIVLGQIPYELDEIDFEDGEIRTLTLDSEKYLMLDKRIRSGENTMWVKGIINISGALNAVNSTIAIDYILILILILIAAIGGYFIVWRALAPISKMRKTAQKIADSNDLSRRIHLGEGKDEVYHLAAVFDEMLSKIEYSFNAEKQFTSDASHELRTPISVILSECEYALDCAKSQEELRDSLTVVKRQSEKMSRLITELLTIARMDKKNLVPNFVETDISELLDIICDEQKEINDNGILLSSDIEPNIIAKADNDLIARLFINIISNAYQYSNDGGNISVSLKKDDSNMIFSVIDNGIGIAEDEVENIWERFYQVNKSRTNENGSIGLGLSMVKQIASIHGGSVNVKSVLGEGSTFTFVMPLNL